MPYIFYVTCEENERKKHLINNLKGKDYTHNPYKTEKIKINSQKKQAKSA